VRKNEVARGPGGRVIVVDSITQIDADDAGAIVVSGSHGGTSSGEVALAVPLAAVFFNDAGIGKDDAGVAALPMLQQLGIAAGAVAHTSARIGDALDAWENGVISRVNSEADKLGLRPGSGLAAALLRLIGQ
jgi:hypothetical protein